MCLSKVTVLYTTNSETYCTQIKQRINQNEGGDKNGIQTVTNLIVLQMSNKTTVKEVGGKTTNSSYFGKWYFD